MLQESHHIGISFGIQQEPCGFWTQTTWPYVLLLLWQCSSHSSLLPAAASLIKWLTLLVAQTLWFWQFWLLCWAMWVWYCCCYYCVCVCVCVGGGGYYIDVHYIDDTVQKCVCVCGVWGGGGGSDFSAGLCEFNCVYLWEERWGGVDQHEIEKLFGCLPFFFFFFVVVVCLLVLFMVHINLILLLVFVKA